LAQFSGIFTRRLRQNRQCGLETGSGR
jgi:hypothetical protein